MKRRIRLTESDLHNIIKESVNHILSELDWRTYQSAADKARKISDETENPYEDIRRRKQADNFAKMRSEKFTSQYNLPQSFDTDIQDKDNNITQGQLKNAARRLQDWLDFHDRKSEYKNGKWQ